MCSPTAAIGALISAASSAIQMDAQNDAARDAAISRNTQIKYENEARYNREVEENQKMSLDKLEKERETMRKIALARVAGGEAGIGGNSLLRQYQTTELQGSYDEGIIETNRNNAVQQLRLEADAAVAGGEGFSNAMNNKMSDGVGAALGIGGAALDGYARYGGEFGLETTDPTSDYTHHRSDGLH